MVMMSRILVSPFLHSPPCHHYTRTPVPMPAGARIYYQGPTQIKFPMLCKWNRGSPGVTVVNCDGSYKPSRRCSGYGFIVRNCIGQVITAKAVHRENDSACAQHITDETKVLQVELKAIRDSLICVRHLGVGLVEIRSDSRNAVAIISGEKNCPRECLAILREIQIEIPYFGPNLIFGFVYRESNRAADFLSKFCTLAGEIILNADDLPQELQRIVFEDAMGVCVVRQPKHKISDL